MQRLPEYLKRPIIDTDKTKKVRHILRDMSLNTVCENARCPNKNECYMHNTATFLIMGKVCTRNCLYCNIGCEKPEPLDGNEPKNIALAIKELGLKYAVLTSPTRDDLKDGGAGHFKKCIEEIRFINPDCKIEILTPDFKGDKSALNIILEASPDVFNHNIEAVKRIFKDVRPQGDYERSIQVLKYMKDNGLKTKSGLIIGLGENYDDIKDTLADLHSVGCDILTIGQYIQPSKKHYEIKKIYTPEEYENLKQMAKDAGIRNYHIGPLVRSSYRAGSIL